LGQKYVEIPPRQAYSLDTAIFGLKKIAASSICA